MYNKYVFVQAKRHGCPIIIEAFDGKYLYLFYFCSLVSVPFRFIFVLSHMPFPYLYYLCAEKMVIVDMVDALHIAVVRIIRLVISLKFHHVCLFTELLRNSTCDE